MLIFALCADVDLVLPNPSMKSVATKPLTSSSCSSLEIVQTHVPNSPASSLVTLYCAEFLRFSGFMSPFVI